MSVMLPIFAKVDLSEFVYIAIGLAALVIILLILKPR